MVWVIKYEKNYLNSFFFVTKINATVIYDYEIESFISEIIELVDFDKKNKINFSLILNDIPNAYVSENNKIILTSGLLKYIQSTEALIGVIAHEIGHIKNYHLTKRKKRVKEMQLLDQVTSLAAITSSVVYANPEIFLQSTLASKSNIQNYYFAFSKNQEKEADLFSVKKLNDLNISTKGLIEFLKSLERESNKKG